ncbi:alpha/beta hydrolase [bacterium]|nr:MAG: alpha/beta hydrolase [bacterium]
MANQINNSFTVVLVHGAFADGSSWSKVITLLQEQKVNVVIVQNPTTSLADDVAAVNRALESVTTPVILVGHSWGGVVITQAGQSDKVAALVYVSAFAPSEGQSITDLFSAYPPPAWFGTVSADSGGYLKLSAQGIADYFAPDLTPTEIGLVAATQVPFAASSNNDKVSVAAWTTKPSWTVISDDDRIISPELQNAMAEKIGAHTTHLPASHVSMVAKPAEVTAVILEAAKAVVGE